MWGMGLGMTAQVVELDEHNVDAYFNLGTVLQVVSLTRIFVSSVVDCVNV